MPALCFDFSWRSAGSIWTPAGVTGSARGTFTVDVSAGQVFTAANLTQLDVTVSLQGGTIDIGPFVAASVFDGAVSGAGDAATFTDIILVTAAMDVVFACDDVDCVNGQVTLFGTPSNDTLWAFGSTAAALGSFVADRSAVPEPATLALRGLGRAGIGYRRHRSKTAA